MKAIFSSDLNPTYKDFLPYVSSAWKSVGFDPFFVEVTEKSEFFVPGIPLGNQAQMIRVLLPSLYKDEIFITSDIDMLPISLEYFSKTTKFLTSKNQIINLSADAYKESDKRHPICYWLGFGDIFSKITGVRDIQDIKCAMLEWFSYGHGWDTDEKIFSSLALEKANKKEVDLLGLQRGWQNGIASRRIDRSNWSINKNALESNFYIDAHMLRPLQENLDWLRPLFKKLEL